MVPVVRSFFADAFKRASATHVEHLVSNHGLKWLNCGSFCSLLLRRRLDAQARMCNRLRTQIQFLVARTCKIRFYQSLRSSSCPRRPRHLHHDITLESNALHWNSMFCPGYMQEKNRIREEAFSCMWHSACDSLHVICTKDVTILAHYKEKQSRDVHNTMPSRALDRDLFYVQAWEKYLKGNHHGCERRRELLRWSQSLRCACDRFERRPTPR